MEEGELTESLASLIPLAERRDSGSRGTSVDEKGGVSDLTFTLSCEAETGMEDFRRGGSDLALTIETLLSCALLEESALDGAGDGGLLDCFVAIARASASSSWWWSSDDGWSLSSSSLIRPSFGIFRALDFLVVSG